MKKIIKSLFLPVVCVLIATSFTAAYWTDGANLDSSSFSTGLWNPGKATVSEVLYNPASTDTGLEWVEIYNSGGYALDMTGYDLYAGGAGYYTFPSFTLNSGALVVVHTNTIGTNTATDLYTGASSNMSDTADSVTIFSSATHNSSTIKDFVQYGAGSQTWQSAANTAGIWTDSNFVPLVTAEGDSMELIGKVDNNLVTDWQDQAVPTPGA